MLESFFVILSFVIGRWMGISQSKNSSSLVKDIEERIHNAENKAEIWKRRYDNLLFHVNKTSKE